MRFGTTHRRTRGRTVTDTVDVDGFGAAETGLGATAADSAGGMSHGGPVKAGNCGSGASPDEPVAGTSLKQSTARPFSVITEPSGRVCAPTGTNSCGWSNGAAAFATRGSVSASRKATTESFSASVSPRSLIAFCGLAKSPPRL